MLERITQHCLCPRWRRRSRARGRTGAAGRARLRAPAGARAGGARGREQAHRGALFAAAWATTGLADFKLKLAGSVSEGVPFIHRSVDADDKTGDVLVKVVDNAVAAFLQYRNAASSGAIERAVDAIAATWKTGHRIEIYGVGNSGIVAQDAQHKFFRLGVTSISTSDGQCR